MDCFLPVERRATRTNTAIHMPVYQNVCQWKEQGHSLLVQTATTLNTHHLLGRSPQVRGTQSTNQELVPYTAAPLSQSLIGPNTVKHWFFQLGCTLHVQSSGERKKKKIYHTGVWAFLLESCVLTRDDSCTEGLFRWAQGSLMRS